MLSTTACAPRQVPVLVTRTAPAILVGQCPREPGFPAGGFADENERYAWAVGAINSGRVCRYAHDGLAQWELSPPKT